MAVLLNRNSGVGAPYLERTTSPAITAWTMCGWFYFTSDADHQTVFGIGDASGHFMVVNRDATTGDLHISSDAGGTAGLSPGFALNQWVYICLTLSGSTATLYAAKSGDVALTSVSRSYTGSWTPNSLSISTSYAPDGAHMRATNTFVFASALSGAQALAQMTKFNPQTTAWAWYQIAAAASCTTDSSGNSRPLTLTGSVSDVAECTGFWTDLGGGLGVGGWEPLGPQTISPRGKEGASFSGPLTAFPLRSNGFEPPSPRVLQPKAAAGPNVDGFPAFVAPLGVTGWYPTPPVPIERTPQQGVNADPGGIVASLRPSGWEPPPPVTVSPRGKSGASFDGPLPAWLYPGGWEPPPPVTKSPRGKIGTAFDGPLTAWLYPAGAEPASPTTTSPRGRIGVSFDGPMLAFLYPGGWEPAAPTPASPRGRVGASFDAPLVPFLYPTGWEPLAPTTASPRPKGAVNFDGPFIPFLMPGGWDVGPSVVRAMPRPARGDGDGGPWAAFVQPLAVTGWEPAPPRTVSPHGSPGPNFDGWPAFPLRTSGFEPPAPRTASPRGKTGSDFSPLSLFIGLLGATGWEPPGPITSSPRGRTAPAFDGPLVPFPLRAGGWEPASPITRTPRPGIGVSHDPFLTVITVLAPAGWEPASGRAPSTSRGAVGQNADAGILVPPRLLTGWEPSSPYLPRAPRPGVGWNWDGPMPAFLGITGWEPEAPRTKSPRGAPGPNWDGPMAALLRASGWEPEAPRTRTPRPGQGVPWTGPMAPLALRPTGWEPAQPRNRWIPPGIGYFDLVYAGILYPPPLLHSFLYGPPLRVAFENSVLTISMSPSWLMAADCSFCAAGKCDADFHLTQGDLLPLMRTVLLAPDGKTPQDLSGAQVTVELQKADLSGPLFGGAVGVPDAVNGVVEYTWVPGDSDADGLFTGQFKVVIGGKPAHWPTYKFRLRVLPKLVAA